MCTLSQAVGRPKDSFQAASRSCATGSVSHTVCSYATAPKIQSKLQKQAVQQGAVRAATYFYQLLLESVLISYVIPCVCMLSYHMNNPTQSAWRAHPTARYPTARYPTAR